jgi:hypothetical protein
MTIHLTNPIAAFTEKIAQPFDDAAPVVRKVATLYSASNTHLHTNQQKLSATFSGLGATAFVDMIHKQVGWVDTIINNLDDLAGFYETCARDVRLAGQVIESAIEPFLDIAQWVLDRLTPDIVVKQGEDAVHAVFSDMYSQLRREAHDAGGFFSSIAHLHFGSALHDAVDEVKGLAHLGGDILALATSVEQILCQWAADIYQAINWLLNKLNSWILVAEDWLLGLSSIADDTVIFVDPNATSEEKRFAGIDMGLNIGMDILLFIPGVDLFDLAGKGALKLLEKFGLKAIEEQVLKQIVKFMETVTLKELRQKIAQRILATFTNRLDELFLKIAGADIDRLAATDILRELVGKKSLPPLTITEAARKEIYERLLTEFPTIDADFIARLVAARPQKKWLSEAQIRNFLSKASSQGELDYIRFLYTYVYKSDRSGLDKLLFDLANGNPQDYKGSLYQLEWLAGHTNTVKVIEAFDTLGQKGPDFILNDGSFVDVKAYRGRPKLIDLEKQITRYVQDFPQIKNHTLHFVFKSGVDGLDQTVIDTFTQRLIAYGNSENVTVMIDLWPK